MEKFLKALGRVLVYVVYIIVVIVIIGIIRWIFKAVTDKVINEDEED